MINFQAIWKLNYPLKLAICKECYAFRLPLAQREKCKGLTCLGKHAGLLPNDCPTAPPAHNTCWSPAGRKAAAHTPVELQCLDLARKVECVRGVGLCSCASAHCPLAEVKRMTPVLETLSSLGMGLESESSREGSAVHSFMTHHGSSFWPFLHCVPLCLGLLVFIQIGQCLWSRTFTSLVCCLFPYNVFFLL